MSKIRLDILQVQSCCYFISLRTATKIFGFLSLLGCLLTIFFSALELISLAKHHRDRVGRVGDKYIRYISELVLDIFVQAIQMFTSVFLLMGVYQEKAKLIPPWLVSTLSCTVLGIVFLLNEKISFYIDNYSSEWIIITVFGLVWDIYGLLVVFSYYRRLAPRW